VLWHGPFLNFMTLKRENTKNAKKKNAFFWLESKQVRDSTFSFPISCRFDVIAQVGSLHVTIRHFVSADNLSIRSDMFLQSQFREWSESRARFTKFKA
jgi:hypothetical protein